MTIHLPYNDNTDAYKKQPLSILLDRGRIFNKLPFRGFGGLHHTAHAAATMHWSAAGFFIFRIISQYTLCC
jgi:hypothetical protein